MLKKWHRTLTAGRGRFSGSRCSTAGNTPGTCAGAMPASKPAQPARAEPSTTVPDTLFTVPDTFFGDTPLPRSIREQRIARQKAGRHEEPSVRVATAREGKP